MVKPSLVVHGAFFFTRSGPLVEDSIDRLSWATFVFEVHTPRDLGSRAFYPTTIKKDMGMGSGFRVPCAHVFGNESRGGKMRLCILLF